MVLGRVVATDLAEDTAACMCSKPPAWGACSAAANVFLGGALTLDAGTPAAVHRLDCRTTTAAIAPLTLFRVALQLICLENCSHWVQQDKPEETNRLMRDFLRGDAQ